MDQSILCLMMCLMVKQDYQNNNVSLWLIFAWIGGITRHLYIYGFQNQDTVIVIGAFTVLLIIYQMARGHRIMAWADHVLLNTVSPFIRLEGIPLFFCSIAVCMMVLWYWQNRTYGGDYLEKRIPFIPCLMVGWVLVYAFFG